MLSFLANYLDRKQHLINGASDIIVIKGKDGFLKSSSFFIRFATIRVSAYEEEDESVDIYINDILAKDVKMYATAAGVCYFKEQTKVNFAEEKGDIADLVEKELDPLKLETTKEKEIDSHKVVETTISTNHCNSRPDNYSMHFIPTHNNLQKLNLKPNHNKIEFITRESKNVITSNIYLWEEDIKIVISDIDGTITKSDVVGFISIPFKFDWTHENIAKYYRLIESNGYTFVYLTSRSVAQSNETKSYIKGINQNGVTMPSGPVLLQPENIYKAIKRDIVDGKSDVYKKNVLCSVKSLFPRDPEVIHAGFGNMRTDILAYQYINIPNSRIFVINTDSKIKTMSDEQTLLSYEDLIERVANDFPIRKTIK